ncbi:uncharacterized protein LOC143292638 [Babylonia areolata]|uniref:uncharacterized protein LOC143292638 n=1 Tax=Babylonia areolata TaxID=304850 RepID=UPI003FD32D1A
MRWQFLVHAERGPLPDITPVRHFFARRGEHVVRVEDTEEGRLVTVNGYPCVLENVLGVVKIILPSCRQQFGHDNVQVDLVVPDVYGCEVAVGEKHVQVYVGRDVINRFSQDEQWRKELLHETQSLEDGPVSVRYLSTGRISVTYLSHSTSPAWELRVINTLIELLSQCEDMFPTDPLPVRDRFFEKCRRRSVQGMTSPDPDDCDTDAIINCSGMDLSIFTEDVFLKKMEETHPRGQFTCDEKQLTLTLSGESDAVKKKTEDIISYVKSPSRGIIQLRDTQAIMMMKTDAQDWFQQSLDNEGIVCVWELQHASTKGGPKGKKKRLFQQARQPTTVISVTATESAVPTFKETLMSCFPTTEIVLGKSQVSHLESDSWKPFLHRLQTSKESTVSPVIKTEKNRVTICDTASNIDITRTAVLEFLHERQMASDPEISQQKVTKTNRKLQPWQVKFLATAQRENQLPECLQQAVSVNIEEEAVHIHAPFHMIHKYSDLLWEYVADLRHEEKQLTAASTQELQSSDSRERVQRLVGEAGVVWDWHVQHERLVVSAHCSHWQQLNEIITSEMETTQSVKMSDAQQQADGQPHENKEQQTDSIHTEDKQIQPETRQEEQETQTEENHMSTEEQHTQSRIRNPQRRWQQTSETDVKIEEGLTQTQTTRPEHKEHQTDESSVEKDSKQGAGFCDQPETQETPTEDRSITLLKSVVNTQEDRTGDRADITTSLCDTWPPQHLSGMMEDPLVTVPTPRSDPHSDLFTRSSVLSMNPSQISSDGFRRSTIPVPSIGTSGRLSSPSGGQRAGRFYDPANQQAGGPRGLLHRATAAPRGFGAYSSVHGPTIPTNTTTTTSNDASNNSNFIHNLSRRLSLNEHRVPSQMEGARDCEPFLLECRMADMQQQLQQLSRIVQQQLQQLSQVQQQLPQQLCQIQQQLSQQLSRIVQQQLQQLGQVERESHQSLQLLLERRTEQSDSDSDILSVCNPSDPSSVWSASS